MSRLPIVGGDQDAWGAILNDFLSVGHNPDGTNIGGLQGPAGPAGPQGPAGAPGTGVQAWQFQPETYGAVGDGVTDDTSAINQAVTAAYNYAVAHIGYAEVLFGAKTYALTSAPTTGTMGTSGQCKAQIPLPVVATTAGKVVLVLRGQVEASALYHWQQTATQKAASTLKSTYALSTAWTLGAEPSVIGGPLPVNGYGSSASLFSNCLVVVTGLEILLPQDPHVCGFDFRGMGEARVANSSVMVDTGAGLVGSVSVPTQGLQFALAMPQANNNDYCVVDNFSAEGQNYGLVASEHTHVFTARCIYCVAGLVCAGGGGSGTPHWMLIDNISVESCQIGLQGGYDTASPTKIIVRCLDWESGGGGWSYFHIVNDASSNLLGDVTIVNVSQATPVTANFITGSGQFLNGATGIKIYDPEVLRGHLTGSAAPAVPASTTNLLNGSGRDAAVTVSGGTVTAITVDGTAMGITAGTVIVPSNKNINVTYSVAPTWQWVLL